MGKRRDEFWNHAQELKDRFKCSYCNRDFSGGISRIKSHLSGIKGRGIDICLAVPEDVKASAASAIGGPCKKAKSSAILPDPKDDQTILASSNCSPKDSNQNAVPKICDKDKSVVDAKLTKFLVSNNIAFDVVETQSFVDFVKDAARYGPDYELPDCLTLQTKFVPDLKQEVKEYVERVKKSWDTTGCTIMLEKLHNFINVVAYSQKGPIFINAYDISKQKHTEFDVRNFVSSIIEDVGVDSIVQFVTNNAAIFDRIGDLIANKCPRVYKTRCVAQEIHYLLKDIFDQVDWVHSVIEDARMIVHSIYEDSNILSLLRKYTNNRELKLPCTTKFASNFQMLQSIFDNKSELQQLIASVEWQELVYHKIIETSNIIKSENFWSKGEEVLKVLQPLVRVLCLVEDDGFTSGYLYEAMEKANEAIYGYCCCTQTKYSKILELLKDRRSNRIINPIHAAAAFLNPSYMCHEDFKENLEMKEGIGFLLENLVKSEEKKAFLNDVQLYRMKASNVFNTMAYEMSGTFHPSVWWDYCGDRLPVLKKYATRILSQPCKSSCNMKYSAFEVAQTKSMEGTTHQSWDNLKFNRKLRKSFTKEGTAPQQNIILDYNKQQQPEQLQQQHLLQQKQHEQQLPDFILLESMGNHLLGGSRLSSIEDREKSLSCTLAVPHEYISELEWLASFVEDSFSEHSTTVHVPLSSTSFSEKTNPQSQFVFLEGLEVSLLDLIRGFIGQTCS